jgi:polyphosphate kinase
MGYAYATSPSMVQDPRAEATSTQALRRRSGPPSNRLEPSDHHRAGARRDILLNYPYESMDAFVRLLQEAAVDPDGRLDQDHAVPPGAASRAWPKR